MQAMLRSLNHVGPNGTMRPLLVSLPLVPPLIDGVRYLWERPKDRCEPILRPRIKAPRAPYRLKPRELTPEQDLAAKQFRKHFATAGEGLEKCRLELGLAGMELLETMLINRKTATWVASKRGQTGQLWPKYYARRYAECLSTLAEVYGFANADMNARRVTAR